MGKCEPAHAVRYLIGNVLFIRRIELQHVLSVHLQQRIENIAHRMGFHSGLGPLQGRAKPSLSQAGRIELRFAGSEMGRTLLQCTCILPEFGNQIFTRGKAYMSHQRQQDVLRFNSDGS